MDRRRALGSLGLAAAGLLGHGLAARPRPPLRACVIGCGIVGASVAMQLAEAGAIVTLVDRAEPAAGATRNSFAWLNAYTLDAHYRELRLRSIDLYHRFDRRLGLGITWGGYIDWAATDVEAQAIRDFVTALRGSPYQVRELDAAGMSALDPALDAHAFTTAIYSPIDGQLDPVHVTRRFVDRARRSGAVLRIACAASGFAARGARVTHVVTTGGPLAVDEVVIAGGIDSPGLLADLGYRLPLRHAPGILAHSAPMPRVTRCVHDGPGGIEFKQMANGQIVANDAEEPPDIPAHREILAHRMDFPSEDLRAAHGHRILAKVAEYLPAAADATLERLTLGFRPMPPDGFPVVGPVPGIENAYVVVTHSGVTLAPILGALASREILQGARSPLLEPYRPTRSFPGPRASS